MKTDDELIRPGAAGIAAKADPEAPPEKHSAEAGVSGGSPLQTKETAAFKETPRAPRSLRSLSRTP